MARQRTNVSCSEVLRSQDETCLGGKEGEVQKIKKSNKQHTDNKKRTRKREGWNGTMGKTVKRLNRLHINLHGNVVPSQ